MKATPGVAPTSMGCRHIPHETSLSGIPDAPDLVRLSIEISVINE